MEEAREKKYLEISLSKILKFRVKMMNQAHYNRVQDQNMHQVSRNRTTLDQNMLKVN